MAFPLIGVLGAGPEVRLLYAAASRLGVRFRVLAQSGRESAARAVPDAMTGDVGDLHVLEAFAQRCAVVLVSDPTIPARELASLEREGVRLIPSLELIDLRDDPTLAVPILARLGIPVVDPANLAVLVAPGVPLPDPTQLAQLAEYEVLVGATPAGHSVVYPVAYRHVEYRPEVDPEASTGHPVPPSPVMVPAPGLSEETATRMQDIALRVVQALKIVGMVAVGFDRSAQVVVGATRITADNAGWTLHAAVTDAFEQHLRAALDLPLGNPSLTAPCVVSGTVVARTANQPTFAAFPEVLRADPSLHLTMYGVDVSPGAHLGHVTAVGNDLVELMERVHRATKTFRREI